MINLLPQSQKRMVYSTDRMAQIWRLRHVALLMLIGWGLVGCASHRLPAQDRSFQMHQDSFAYANELVWEYHLDPETGKFTHSFRDPAPTYSHHCFVVVKAARQFYEHAVFDPDRPVVDEKTYRKLIRRVTTIDPARSLSAEDKIIIPGYRNLHEFSQDQAEILKEECGGAWRSYTQRGHWRMIFPFSRQHQSRMAEQLQNAIRRGHPPIVHIVQFPSLTINHAALLFAQEETEETITFETYDPNRPDRSKLLTYDKASRTFYFPRNYYFVGGAVDVYEIYRSWNY